VGQTAQPRPTSPENAESCVNDAAATSERVARATREDREASASASIRDKAPALPTQVNVPHHRSAVHAKLDSATPQPVAATDAAQCVASSEANLFGALEEGELLYTISGQKPVSEGSLDEKRGFNAARLFDDLQSARADGRLRNTNVDWFVDGEHVYFYNRHSIQALLCDPKRMQLLKPYGYLPGDTVDATVEKLKEFCLRPLKPYVQRSPDEVYEGNLVSGIFFGYPTAEVVAFSEIMRLMQQGLKPTDAEMRVLGKTVGNHLNNRVAVGPPGGPAYISMTGPGTPADLEFVAEGQAALRKLATEKARGLSAWQIINAWDANAVST